MKFPLTYIIIFFFHALTIPLEQTVQGQTIPQGNFGKKFSTPIFIPLRIVDHPFETASSDSSVKVNADSIMKTMTATADTVRRPGKSTTIAWVSSAILPGAGQIYNGSYWKAPLIWGLEYYFFSVYVNQNNLYKQNRKLYEAYLDSSAAGKSYTFDYIGTYKGYRDFYKNQRDTFGWYIAITYLVNVLDAYVDASLYNFEVAPVASDRNELRLTMKVKF
ncbi:MAG: hypothetical protein KGJ59_13700 [Bacteroidota bacterium]|nr:hypothetical protein [Bacteroidota bacterium]